jgi:hypothetical protein
MNDLNGLLAEWERAPSLELRIRLLEEFFAANERSTTIYLNARDRDLLASEQKRSDKAIAASVRIAQALTTSASPSSLASARLRLAAVG